MPGAVTIIALLPRTWLLKLLRKHTEIQSTREVSLGRSFSSSAGDAGCELKERSYFTSRARSGRSLLFEVCSAWTVLVTILYNMLAGLAAEDDAFAHWPLKSSIYEMQTLPCMTVKACRQLNSSNLG